MTNGEKILKEIQARWGKDARLIFISYNKSMWDSMASIQEAALRKKMVADVYAVPFKGKGKNKVYVEGGYKSETYEFNLNNYDVAVVNYPFDDVNTLTAIPWDCHTDRLKAAGLKIVYVPYFGFYCNTDQANKPGVFNADLICVDSENDAQTYIDLGVGDKVIITGSPKVDTYKQTKRKIACVCNSLIPFVNAPDHKLNRYKRIIEELNAEGYLVIFRPHPLLEEGIMRYTPAFWDRYKEFIEWAEYYCLIDKSKEPWKALKNSTVVYGDGASLKLLCDSVGVKYNIL